MILLLILILVFFFLPVVALPAREKRRVEPVRHKTYLPDLSRLKMELNSSETGSFSGYGSVFGNIDSDEEIMAPGAYKETLADFIRDGFIGIGHDWKSGVATIKSASEDSYGLYLEAEFHGDAESQLYRQRVNERLSRGKSVGLSVGFRIAAYEWNEDESTLTITKAELFEVSIVTVPANSKAGVLSAKSGYPGRLPETVREFEDLLRDAGFPRSRATEIASLASKGFGADQRDSDNETAQNAAIAAYLSTQERLNNALLTTVR